MPGVTDDLVAMVGTEIGVSDWFELSADRIRRFNSVVGEPMSDRVSPFLLVSVLPGLLATVASPLPAAQASINYGLDRLEVKQLPAPGSRVRARVVLASIDEVGTALQLKRRIVIEAETGETVALVETLARLVY